MNLLVGVNGTGKTSVLDALAVAAGSWFLGLRGYDTRHIRSEEVRLQAIPAHASGSKNGRSTTPVNWEHQYPCSVEASGEIQGRAVSWKRSLNKPGGRTAYVEAKDIKQLAADADTAVRDGKSIVLPLISYYGTGRLWDIPREQSKVKPGQRLTAKETRSRLAGYRNSIDPRVSVSDLVRWTADQSWIEFQQGAKSPAYEAVRKAIAACLEGARNFYFDARRSEVIVETTGHEPQPFANLSDGQKTLLALVGDLAQKAMTLNPSLGGQALAKTPGVVLIDELDLHLHPIWQRNVIENLRTTFPKIQFFATTHSPFLIQSLRSGEELMMLEGAPTAQLGNKTLAEIAHGIMGVAETEVSERYKEMKHSATRYLETLEQAGKSPAAKLAAFEAELAKAVGPYADNPAFQAFLEMKRAAKLG